MGLHEDIGRPSAPTTPFVWPELRRLSALEQRGQYLRRYLEQVGVELGYANFRLNAGSEGDITPDPLAIKGSWGEQAFLVIIPSSLVPRLLDCGGYCPNAAEIEGPLTALTVEYLMSTAISAIEEASGQPVSLIDTQSCEENLPGLHLSLACPDGDRVGIRLACELEVLNELTQLLSPRRDPPMSSRFDDLQFEAVLRAPKIDVTVRDFEELKIGDALAVNVDWREPDGFRLSVGGCLMAAATLQGGRLIQRGTLHLDTATQRELRTMNTAKEIPSRPKANPIEAMPVTISVELDRVDLSLSELRALTEGSVLPFSPDLPKEVTLVVNGVPFATGELVQLDDRIGVQLNSFA